MSFNIKKYLPSLAFIRGFGSVIDITGTYFININKPYWMKSDLTPQQQDALALRGDWERVGSYLRTAMNKHKKDMHRKSLTNKV